MKKLIALAVTMVACTAFTQLTLATSTGSDGPTRVLTSSADAALPFTPGNDGSTAGTTTSSTVPGGSGTFTGTNGSGTSRPDRFGPPGKFPTRGGSTGTPGSGCNLHKDPTCGSSTGSAGGDCDKARHPSCGSGTSTTSTTWSATTTTTPPTSTSTTTPPATNLPVGFIGAPLLGALLGGGFALTQLRRRRASSHS